MISTEKLEDILIDQLQVFNEKELGVPRDNVEKWELFVRRLYEEGYKIFVTGSNAKLLSSELATRLTGRYFKIELFPFSFKEFLNFKSILNE